MSSELQWALGDASAASKAPEAEVSAALATGRSSKKLSQIV